MRDAIIRHSAGLQDVVTEESISAFCCRIRVSPPGFHQPLCRQSHQDMGQFHLRKTLRTWLTISSGESWQSNRWRRMTGSFRDFCSSTGRLPNTIFCTTPEPVWSHWHTQDKHRTCTEGCLEYFQWSKVPSHYYVALKGKKKKTLCWKKNTSFKVSHEEQGRGYSLVVPAAALMWA